MSQALEPQICAFCHGRSNWDFLRDFFQRMDLLNAHAAKIEGSLYQSRDGEEKLRTALEARDLCLRQTQELLDEERRNTTLRRDSFDEELQRRNVMIAGIEEMLEIEQCDNGELKRENAAIRERLNELFGQLDAVQRTLGVERTKHSQTSQQFDNAYKDAGRLSEMLSKSEARVKQLEQQVSAMACEKARQAARQTRRSSRKTLDRLSRGKSLEGTAPEASVKLESGV